MPPVDTAAAAFVAGLVTSLHCVGMCGPLSCAWAVGGGKGGSSFVAQTSLYHLGRVASYTLVGSLAGLVGYMPLTWFQKGPGLVLPWLLVLVFLLVGVGLDSWLPKPKFLSAALRTIQGRLFRLASSWRALLLGVVTPLLPCGPLYVMFALAMANGSPWKGGEFALAFGLGTLPLLFLAQTQIHWLGGRLQPKTMRYLQRGLALAAAVVMAWRLRGTLEAGGEPTCCHASL